MYFDRMIDGSRHEYNRGGLIKDNRILLGVCNIQQPDRSDLDHVGDYLSHLVGGRSEVAIFPQASANWELAAQRSEKALERYGMRSSRVLSKEIIRLGLGEDYIIDAQAVYIAGGNTFRAVNEFFKALPGMGENYGINLAAIIRRLASEARPIIGVSAGLMMFADDIRTCEDPRIIVEPGEILEVSSEGRISRARSAQLQAPVIPITGLNLLEAGLNLHPHYTPQKESEISEYLTGDAQKRRILAFENGSGIYVTGSSMQFVGEANGSLLEFGRLTETVRPGENISYLLKRD